MARYSEGSWWRIAFIGLVVGWVVGMVCWVGLLLVMEPGFDRDEESGQLVKRPRIVASQAMWAPVSAIPWAVMGLVVGGFTAQWRGSWIPTTAMIGTLVGFVWCLATERFDGWLALLVPVWSLGGTIVGLLVGVPTRAVWGDIRGWDE